MPLGTPFARRTLALTATAVAALSLTAVAYAPKAHADDSSTVTVVGTTDVSDSNLVQAVLKPGFEAAYPQYSLNYVPKGTQDAINYAKAGTASALLVHAASLENQFVHDGYSLEPAGRAVFWGDYVVVGPDSDPVGVSSGGEPSHDVATAYEKIAAAGALGHANYVSRGKAPGTTVAEHAIWAQTSDTAVTKCTVSDTNGGGEQPSTQTGACVDPPTTPSWYQITNAGQADNLKAAETCGFNGGNCYALTDRGTFVYQKSLGVIPDLKIVARDNTADGARGGISLLVNSFHAYAINPAKFAGNSDVQINTAGATAFLNWMTSPAGQAMIGQFENDGGDSPFLPDAAPTLTTSALPTQVIGGKSFGITGTVANVVPGTPAIAGKEVQLYAAPTAHPNAKTLVTTAQTDTDGKFHLVYQPVAARIYSVTVPAITQIEDSTLNPIFTDLLQPKSSGNLGTVPVVGSVRVTSFRGGKGVLGVKGTLAPQVLGSGGRVALFVRKAGSTAPLHFSSQVSVPAGATTFTASYSLPKGSYDYQVRYANTGVIVTGGSFITKVAIS